MADPLAARGEDNPALRFDAIRARTPARVLVGRAGASYPTSALLDLRQDHAAALDAVRGELDLVRDLGPELIERFGLFEVGTQALSKREFLMRPDLGRQLDAGTLATLDAQCPRGATLQVAIGDGLSAAAVAAQVPALLPLLEAGAKARGWSFGRPFVVRYCRVGVLNDIGERLDPALVLLLVGERPGLSTSKSLSAYMAYRPRAGHTDAHRNLISNIHARGLPPDEAARQIFELATTMLRQKRSGVSLGATSASGELGPPTHS
ncbi:Ethanolamine ammonia-lyase light chain [Singulisphaera sp. GP187]|uniref:ethanolamine ammonia-lyase subunit EutC n=1 Tax=Singulisphaera sp. GP187 TaxID=1882752 RepID=UPI00092BCB1A|nr:ethanolamine ammonia-lyase subunit EutC [Singulisphaera sp. GP187]SIN82609.1 Ethanolamine ammonia-lyase light chain [Singulisphaera sp. GP187]